MSTKRCDCESPRRCRKRAEFVVAYLVDFATRIGPNGEEAVKTRRYALRCTSHKLESVPGERVAVLPLPHP